MDLSNDFTCMFMTFEHCLKLIYLSIVCIKCENVLFKFGEEDSKTLVLFV
jgi:hypothetical protein